MKIKKLFNTFIASFIMIASCAFSSCGDNDNDDGIKDPAFLIGTWQGYSANGWIESNDEKFHLKDSEIMNDTRVVFRADNTYEEQESYADGTAWDATEKGTWKLEGNNLVRYYDDGTSLYEDGILYEKILTLTSDKLIIKSAQQSNDEKGEITVEFHRVNE